MIELGMSAGELFQEFLDGQPRTRRDIAASSGLGRTAVATRIDALLTLGLLTPAGVTGSTGGRPPQTVQFNAHSGRILALDFGARHATIGLTDLSGTPLATSALAIDIASGPDECLRVALAEARTLIAGSPGRILGVGVGLPGPVEHATGRPVNPPIMPGWDGFDVPAAVRAQIPCDHVRVDNDVNILAIGEHAQREDVDDLVYVKVATGIGAGIVAGGRIQRGAQGSAGDLGHIHVHLPGNSLTFAGDERDLEAIASGEALAAALRAAGRDTQASEDVVTLLRGGDKEAGDLAREAGRLLGEALAIIVNLLNPSLIVVGGSLGRASDHLIAGAREIVYRRSIPLATQHLRIEPARAGAEAGVRGAARMVLHYALAPEVIDERLALT